MLHLVDDEPNATALSNLSTYIEELSRCQAELRRELAVARDQARSREAGLETSLRELKTSLELLRGDIAATDHGAARLSTSGPAHRKDYEQLVAGIREIVPGVVPPNARVLVVSRGDEQLLQFPGRRGAHFPQTPEGVYMGHHPADGGEAIAHLEQLRAQGAGALLFPRTGFWWLDYYQDFREHLDARYRRIWSDEQCVIYDLTPANAGEADALVEAPIRTGADGLAWAGLAANEIGEIVQSGLRLGATVVVMTASGQARRHGGA